MLYWFSSFQAKPLINIHDLAVLPSHRGQGIGHRLIDAVAVRGRELGCCKMTLEVRPDNEPAWRCIKKPVLTARCWGIIRTG